MKQLRLIFLSCTLFFYIGTVAYSQVPTGDAKSLIFDPYHLFITVNKTTNLVFPYAIISVDIGSPDVLAQKAMGVENVLYVKAGIANFTETNITVITSDGKLYSFILNYTLSPSALNISFGNDPKLEQKRTVILTGKNEAEMQSMAKQVLMKKRVIHGLKANTNSVFFQINGIYTKDDVIYLALQLKNKSYVNYDVQSLRFFIRDERKFKRTATQEIELEPLYTYGDTSVVTGKSKNVSVFALQKFTVPRGKYLSIQLMERNGGRHLNLRIRNLVIGNARILKST